MPGGIDVNKMNGILRAYFYARRFTPTKITFGDFTAIKIIVDGAKWAGDGADFATYAAFFGYDFCARCLIDGNGFYRAGTHTPGFFALGAGKGDVALGFAELEYLDS